jgi:hypothetical protein
MFRKHARQYCVRNLKKSGTSTGWLLKSLYAESECSGWEDDNEERSTLGSSNKGMRSAGRNQSDLYRLA